MNAVCVFSFGKFHDGFFVLYLANSGNPQCRKGPIRHPVFWTTWELCLPFLSVPSTRRDHLVLNIPVWSTDSYSSTVIPTKQFAASVLIWFVWRRNVLTTFLHNLPWDQIFLHLYLPRRNQNDSGIPMPEQLLRPKTVSSAQIQVVAEMI